ncbi:MAG: universal stress protein [Alphaproteobacteria bacterium]
MTKIIACFDGSKYADSVCHYAAWAHQRTGLDIGLLHVVHPHSDMQAQPDVSGQIGLGAKTSLLEELTKLDEAHGKLEMRRGQLILEHAVEELTKTGVTALTKLHRRGSLVDTITGMEDDVGLIVIGKRGEHHQNEPQHLGSKLEKVARAVHKPILVATLKTRPINRFLLAYDGSPTAKRAVDYVAGSDLLKGLDCHILTLSDQPDLARQRAQDAADKLTASGYSVTTAVKTEGTVEQAVTQYVDEHQIDLLAIGAYGHSRIRSLILGSTTTTLIRETHIPALLFR